MTKFKSYYPSGYEYKKGLLISGTQYTNIPANKNIIPLVMKINGGSSWNNTSNYVQSHISVRDNNGKYYFDVYANGGRWEVVNTTIQIYIPVFYNYDWKEMKKITQFISSVSTGERGRFPTIEITEWLENSGGGGGISPLLKKSSTFLQKVVLTMLGRVLINQKSEYAGYKIMRGTKDIVSTSNDGVISRLIPQEIIPLTFKLEWSGTAKWYIHFAMQSAPIGWINGFIWSGGGKETCMTYMDVESLYGLEYLKKCKYFGGNATNATGTYKISIVKWLEKAGA